MRRRGRKLTEDERALWRKVTRDVAETPKAPAPVVEAEAAAPRPPLKQPALKRVFTETLRPVGSSAAYMPPPVTPKPNSGLDRKTEARLKKGQRTPDARLDLHGMSAVRAHAALKMFIADAQAVGHRCVLVITGKGSDATPMMGETAPGVLRREAPHWLATPPLSQMVVNVSQAHPRHGGGGALYVYLKRRR